MRHKLQALQPDGPTPLKPSKDCRLANVWITFGWNESSCKSLKRAGLWREVLVCERVFILHPMTWMSVKDYLQTWETNTCFKMVEDHLWLQNGHFKKDRPFRKRSAIPNRMPQIQNLAAVKTALHMDFEETISKSLDSYPAWRLRSRYCN
jgi:hypothetical protein